MSALSEPGAAAASFGDLATVMAAQVHVLGELGPEVPFVPRALLQHICELWTIAMERLAASEMQASRAIRVLGESAGTPNAEPASERYRRATLTEELDVLALLGLGNLLCEAIAAFDLPRLKVDLPAREPGEKEPSLWDRYVRNLESRRDPAAPFAADVDLRLRAAGNLLVRHPSGRPEMTGHDAEGRLTSYGGKLSTSKAARDHALTEFARLNSSLPESDRSTATNTWDFARELIGKGPSFASKQRDELAQAMRDFALDVDVREIARAAVALVGRVTSLTQSQVNE